MKFPDRSIIGSVEIEGAGEFDVVLERRSAEAVSPGNASGTPRPGIDRLACPGCGMSWAYCQQGMGRAYGSPDVCCLSCRHQVRPCIGNDAG